MEPPEQRCGGKAWECCSGQLGEVPTTAYCETRGSLRWRGYEKREVDELDDSIRFFGVLDDLHDFQRE